MLSNFSSPCGSVRPVEQTMPEYNRNEQEDLKTAIDYIYELRNKISKLHPNVLYIVNSMLSQKQNY